MGVYSDGSYGVPSGLIYSFPVTCSGGEWKIVQGNAWLETLPAPYIGACRYLSCKLTFCFV
jgi:hypothetical protein